MAEDAPEVLERFHATLPLVDATARQILSTIGQGHELEDLVSYGREGLLDAARRYDPSRGVPFRGYASYRVRGAIIDGVRTMSRLPRRAYQRLNSLAAGARFSEGALEDVSAAPAQARTRSQADALLSQHLSGMATAIAIGLVAEPVRGEDGELTSVTEEHPEALYESAELMKIVVEAIGELPDDEAQLLRRHYLEGERFDRVAEELKMSKSWASRLHTRAIARLTKRLTRKAVV